MVFQTRDGRKHLHCGDCRYHTSFNQRPILNCGRFDTLFLDTTYCNPSHTFPLQVPTLPSANRSPDAARSTTLCQGMICFATNAPPAHIRPRSTLSGPLPSKIERKNQGVNLCIDTLSGTCQCG